MDDFPEISYRDRLEHFARGYEWTYFVGARASPRQDMTLWKYPSDQEMLDLDLRGIYLGNYVYWEANEHIEAGARALRLRGQRRAVRPHLPHACRTSTTCTRTACTTT